MAQRTGEYGEGRWRTGEAGLAVGGETGGGKVHRRNGGSSVASVSWTMHVFGGGKFSKISKSLVLMREMIKLCICFISVK